MLNKIFYITLFLFFVFADEVTLNQAQIISTNFINSKIENSSFYSVKSIESIDTKYSVSGIYIVRLNPSGFIIISADRRSRPILGYSFHNNIDFNDLPLQLKSIIDSYILGLEYLIDNNIPADDESNQLFEEYLNESFNNINHSRLVDPLITANWNQGGEWNDFCPNNSVVGCVAVAMAQVMNYWEYPNQGSGYSQYFDQNHGIIAVNFEEYNYDFSNMPDDYATEDSQLLLYHSGVAVQMNYSQWGSGASVCWEGPSAQAALDENFSYNDDITCEVKINYSDEEWEELIKDQLDRGWPIIYRGYSGDSGHAWNIDGYEDDYYHCNWGWGGSSNGYFYFDNLNGGGYNFIDSQAALLNIIPQNIIEPSALYDFSINDLSVEFNDLSQLVNEDQIIQWEWDFGDGNYSYSQSPMHIYADYGTYEVSLTVMSSFGLNSIPHFEAISLIDLFGDINQDFTVNVLDVIQLVNYILDNEINQDFELYDLNFDFQINILDIISLVQRIIN